MVTTEELLGIGIYSIAEAAFYARVSERMMKRWIFGTADGKSVIDPELGDRDEKVVTFLDFVQTLAIREIRQRYKLSLQKIRQGVDEAKSKYNIPYPLAQKHRIFLFSDGRADGNGHIVICLNDDSDEEIKQYIQITGKDKGAFLMKPVVEMFLQDLMFDEQTRMALEYRPLSENGVSVVMNPHQRFGEPIILPSGYTAETLWHATNAEGGIESAAIAYGVTKEEVSLANKYYDLLSTSVAA